MISLTKYESCLLNVIAKDEYNALNGDWDANNPPERGDLATWTNVEAWKNDMNYVMKMEKTKSFALPEIKGFLGSLVKKGLIECDKESKKNENDETTYFTELGFQTIIEIKKENAMTTTTTIPTKKDQVKISIMEYLSKSDATDQTFLIRECLPIAGKTTIKNAIKELEKEGAIERRMILGLLCWNIRPIETPVEVSVETPSETPAPKKTRKEHLKESIKVKVKAEKKEKSPKEKVVGVIASIIELLETKEMTKKEILTALVLRFPAREAAKMEKTVNVQVPSRLKKDKNLKIQKTEKGYKINK
jgi:hypothetical protein